MTTDIIVGPSSEVVLLPQISAETAYASGGIEKIIESLEKKVRAIPVDISTEEGRQACASVAYQIARSKTALDDMGAKLTEEWRQRTNAVNADRRVARDRLDKLKAEYRAPLTNWENAQKERVAAHENALRELDSLCQNVPLASADIAARLVRLPDYDNRGWEEFSNRAEDMSVRVRKVLQDAHDAAVTREEEAAELARLRAREAQRQAEEAERERQARDARLAEEAAAKARQQAIEEAEAAAAEKIRQAEERAALAERRAAQADVDRVAAEQRAADDLAAAQADADRFRRGTTASMDQQRIADGKGAEPVGAGEPTKERREQVNRAIMMAFVNLGAPEPLARDLVTAISRGQVQHIQIGY